MARRANVAGSRLQGDLGLEQGGTPQATATSVRPISPPAGPSAWPLCLLYATGSPPLAWRSIRGRDSLAAFSTSAGVFRIPLLIPGTGVTILAQALHHHVQR